MSTQIGKNSPLPAIDSYNGTSSCDKEDSCHLFADFFMGAFATEDSGFSLNAALKQRALRRCRWWCAWHNNKNIIKDSVLRALKQVALRPQFLPNVAKFRSDLALVSYMFLDAWNMFAVYKKGDKTLVENYHGITTFTTGAKVFEVVVQNSLLSSCRLLITTRVLSPSQFDHHNDWVSKACIGRHFRIGRYAK